MITARNTDAQDNLWLCV